MKILAIVELYYHKNKSGGESYLHYILKQIKKNINCQITILLPNCEKMAMLEFGGINICETTEKFEECEKYIDDCDLVITQLMLSNKVIEATLKKNKPLLWILHGYFNGFHKYIENPSITKIFNSKNVLCDFQSKDLEIENYHIIYPYTDFPTYNSFKDKDLWRREYITFVNPCVNKGVELVLKLAKRNSARKFLIVEGGYMNDEAQPFLIEFKKLPNCHIIRNTNEMIKDVYSKSRIVIMPSKYESYGMVCSEASSMGIPVIINKNTKGLVENMGELSLGGYGDDAETYQKVIELLDNKETYFLWSKLYEERMEDRHNEVNFSILRFIDSVFIKQDEVSEEQEEQEHDEVSQENIKMTIEEIIANH